jgi:hypothetical protein
MPARGFWDAVNSWLISASMVRDWTSLERFVDRFMVMFSLTPKAIDEVA